MNGFDDEFDPTSAILGNQPQPAGTPLTGTPGPFGGSPSTSASPGSTSTPAAQPPAQRNALQTNALAAGGDSYATAIMGDAGAAQGANLKGGEPQPGGQAGPDDAIARYTDQVTRISQATDPATRAREQDSLARNLFDTLRQAGHDVKWEGDTLVVNGRRYVVGGSGGASDITGGNTGITGGMNLGAGNIVDSQAQPAAGGGTTFATEGFNPDKAGKNDPKYIFQRIAQTYNWNDPAQREAALQALRADPSGYFANATLNGDILDVGSNDPVYNGIHQFDIQRDTENGGPLQWNPVGQGGGAGVASGILGVSAPGAAGVGLGGTPGAVPGAAPAPGPAAMPSFLTDGPDYQPGEIGMDDIPDVDPNAILGQMGTYQPEHYQVGDLEDGPVAGDEESLMRSILGNPESLDPTTIARMKVGSREQAAQLGQQDDAEAVALGYEGGFADSPWLASQRLARRGQTNEQIQKGDREVDIEAARTNAGDRRSAAALGSSYLSERGAAKRGNEALRQSGASLNSQNAFNAANLQSNNVVQSTKLALDASAAKGDRMALRESVNQAAAQLGISKDKLMLDYVTSQMDDMTKRLGIDVQAALGREGFQVDREKLAQSGREFHEELAFKLQQLAQQYETDMSGIGLGYAKLGNDAYLGELNALNNATFG